MPFKLYVLLECRIHFDILLLRAIFFIILFLKCFAKAISAHTYLRKNELHSVQSTSWIVKNAMSRATSGAIYDTFDKADCI